MNLGAFFAAMDRYIADLKSAGLDRIMDELKTIYDKQQIEQRQYLARF
ncbi:MAG: hypothetical protein LBP80_01785 [Treponema sp.]|jgi:molybdenum cofactor biosynthesis enzyme MoaA|nr:hypothetical protein [Treponema sp.]